MGLKRRTNRIAIVGDSVTFGEGIPNTADTFVKVMERILNEKQTAVKVRTFNYGVSAYSVKSMAASLRYRMFDIDPDLVVMAIMARSLIWIGRPPWMRLDTSWIQHWLISQYSRR